MNKKEFLEAIAGQAGMTIKDAESCFNATFGTIKQILINNDKLNIPGFGGFGVKVRASRKGRNPSTGKEIQIPEARIAYFKPGVQLKEELNPSDDQK